MAPLAAILEGSCDPGGLREVGATPPQHGKTELIEHALLKLSRSHPKRRHAYVTYNAERAEYVSRHFQRLAERAGMRPSGRLSDVLLDGGTEIRFTSIGGSLTGFTVDGLLIIDDPHKDRVEAESPTLRKQVIEWFTDVARTRRHASTSILCIATRWHPEDLSGDLIGRGYRYTNLKAIAEGQTGSDGIVMDDPLLRHQGESLWHAKPPAFFAEERQDAYTWESLYQGEPRGRGHHVFSWPDVAEKARWYHDPPSAAVSRYTIGLDFAYTSKTYADYSAAVVMAHSGGKYFVVDVLRMQCEAREFRAHVKALAAQYPSASARAYVGGSEHGVVEFVKECGLQVQGLSAAKAGDKFTRAVGVAAAWNSGKILVPSKASWRDAFLAEVCGFTGVKDRHDDQVDAMAAAFDEMGVQPFQYGRLESPLS